jgi:hypothetical protein
MEQDRPSPETVASSKLERSFDFVEKEMDFLAAFSALSGAAAAWLANATLLKKYADQPEILHARLIGAPHWFTPIVLVKVAALALAATAILALLERGKISRMYGQLVIHKALDKSIERSELEELLRKDITGFSRNILRLNAWRPHWEYYLARVTFLVGVLATLAVGLWPDLAG